MRVSRSLTIKQMVVVSSVALVTIFMFISIQLFHFVDQRRDDYVLQMKNIAHSVELPLSEAMFNMELYKAQYILDNLNSLGVLSRADIMLPNEFRALHGKFPNEQNVPVWINRMFDLPLQTTIPLYSPYQGVPVAEPIGSLVLQVDSYRMYRFIMDTIATMVVTYLLLVLILSIAISWCINRLLVYPLRAIALDLHDMALDTPEHHVLTLSAQHKDDELGLLVRNYNRNQQALTKAYKALSRMSTRYPVTDLPNSRLFKELVQQHLLTATKNNTGFSLLMIRVQTLTETIGVLETDQQSQLIKDIAERLKRNENEHCLVAQLGPGEFALLAKGNESPTQGMLLARHILEQLNEPLCLQDIELRPSASIGISHYPDDGDTADSLIRRAHSAMTSAQKQSQNTILFFEPRLTEITQNRLTQESAILKGMEQGQFSLYYQPQIDMSTGKISGAEALLRWYHNGVLQGYPDDFIPLAEETGLMLPLGDWVLEEACRVLAEWQKQGIQLPLCVNLSGMQIQVDNIVFRVEELINSYQIEPGLLTLEITETARIEDLNLELPKLQQLRALGVSLALDDFGTGYSSLTYLHRLPVDVVKIDRSFIQGLPDDNALARILGTIADVFKLDVIAEGVENEEQKEWLLAHGIHCAQGYLYSPAIPREEFEKAYLFK